VTTSEQFSSRQGARNKPAGHRYLAGRVMQAANSITTQQRLRKLERHLKKENPVLLDVVRGFRRLDKVAYAMGLLRRDESFAARVPWWPLVSLLGTFSSGKSTFINDFVGERLQNTGTQAVDDKFTVICYSNDAQQRVLPGLALDADPRFPFYQISQDIEEVATGEGRRVDAYLQLKTSASEKLRGKIIIDSPGFDADAQRNSTLRLTDHIIDLSDLVLVFFYARHPEPGAMQDTLEHLVANTINRPDSNKFLYILNLIDVTAREDNLEEVFGAWQRALAQKGLTAGRFYSIYSPAAAIPIEDPGLKKRFEAKRATDMAEIEERIAHVEVERAYRIIGVLEKTAKAIEADLLPPIRKAKIRWKRRVLWADTLLLGITGTAAVAWSIHAGYWDGLWFAPPWLDWLTAGEHRLNLVLGSIGLVAIYLHFSIRRLAAHTVVAGMRRDPDLSSERDAVIQAFIKNTWPLFSIFHTGPVGWNSWARRRLERVLRDADRHVQSLNDRFTDPSGKKPRAPTPKVPATGASDEAKDAKPTEPPPAQDSSLN